MILERIREISAAELTARQAQLDAGTAEPDETCRPFHESGLSNWWLPARLGGLGVCLEDSVDIATEIAYSDAGTAFTLFASILGSSMITLYGSPELQEIYLAPMASNGGFCATLGSEQEPGSKPIAVTAAAGTDLILNGETDFATNAGSADFLVVIATYANGQGDPLAAVVPRDHSGVHIVKRWNTLEVRAAPAYQVSLRDCRIPADHVLNGHGLGILAVGMNASRILSAATAVGIALRIRDECMTHAKTQSPNGAALMADHASGAKLAQMETQIDVMRNQCRAAAREFDLIMARRNAATLFLRHGTLKSALVAKMFCGQAGWQIASAGSEMFGVLGYTDEPIIGKLLRDMRYVSIVDGGDDTARDLLFNDHVIPALKLR